MEPLKRKRAQFRREFTVTADLLEKALQTKDVKIAETKYATLIDCAEQLFSCEVSIRDMWCQADDFDEVEYQADQDKAFRYRTRWLQLKTKCNKSFSKSNKNSDCDNDNDSLVSARSSCKASQHQSKIKMPKLEIIKFNGEVKMWLLFWGQFQKIDQDPAIDKADKFQYLLQSMEPNSSARQLVESYPPCSENYTKALGALKSRFARDDILIETYVRGLLTLIQDKGVSSTRSLPTLYDILQTQLQALETLEVTRDKYASISFPMVEPALPEEVLRVWNRNRADDNCNYNLSKLVDFLTLEVESEEERILLARQGSSKLSTLELKASTCCFVTENKPNNRNSRIKWNFLPPSAPWWGGFYERLIGVVKEGLRRVLGRASVSLNELSTVLCDCEATINSRPLTYISNSVDELRPLTPSDFIQPLCQNDVTDFDQIDHNSLNSRAVYCQTLRQGFRQRFRKEYLSTLVHSNERKPKNITLEVGDIVLVETEDHKRTNWPIGRVVEVYPSSDNVVRVVRVRTAAGDKVRPLQRLYPLELPKSSTVLKTPLPTSTTSENNTTKETDSDELRSEPTKTRIGRILKVPKALQDYVT